MTVDGRLFHALAAATRNARSPSDGLLVAGTTSAVVCDRCATSPYREVCGAKGGLGSGETLCHDIYPARPITTVSLIANTCCMNA